MAPQETKRGLKIRGLPAQDDVEEPPAKEARKAPKPEELHKGAVVIYAPGKRGVVRDAYGPLDEFWIADESTNELVRDPATNDIKSFKSAELKLPPPQKPQAADEGGGIAARVLLIGGEQHMLQVLEHFGPPDASQRQEPQQLLAIPCASAKCGPFCARFDPMSREMCDPQVCPMCHVASDGVDEAMMKLAQSFRPDIHVAIRSYHLKQAVEQIGPDMHKLQGKFALTSVTLPYSQEDIEQVQGWQKYYREEVRCQIDIGVTADGAHEDGEDTPDKTARRALGETCGVCISDGLWSEETQFALRRKMGVDIPLKFWDGEQCKVFVIIIPDDAKASTEDAILVFSEGAGSGRSSHAAMLSAASAAPAKGSSGGDASSGTKTVSWWRVNQDQFKHLPQLPTDWIRIKSKSDDIYFFNVKTQKSMFDFPLPDGWTKQTSKSTGKTYYFNAKKRKSMFEIPTERD